MPNYFIIEEFNAPNAIKKDKDGKAVYKLFYKGDFIAGKEAKHTRKSGNTISVIRTKDFYLIPIEKTEQWNADNSENAEALKQTQEKVSEIANQSYVEDLVNLSKRSVKGSAIGLMIGFSYGVLKHKNLKWCSMIGAFAGGILGYGYAKFKQQQDINKKTLQNGVTQ